MAQYTDETKTVIEAGGRFIPVDPRNKDYRRLIASGVVVSDAPVNLPEEKAALKALVDENAEQVRLQFITPGFGQNMVYLQKWEQAKVAVQETGDIPVGKYPFLDAEVSITADTIKEVAQIIVDTADQWIDIAATIENKRQTAKKNIDAATTVKDAKTASKVDWRAVLPRR